MLLNRLRLISLGLKFIPGCRYSHSFRKIQLQRVKPLVSNITLPPKPEEVALSESEASEKRLSSCEKHAAAASASSGQICPAPADRVVPMVLANKDSIVLSFDDVPGPKTLKYLSVFRNYMSDVGTQMMAALLTFGLNVGSYISSRKPIRNLSTLFDEYGPVVRFVSPVGGDIVLLNHPEHIQKVYSMEGELPVRSTLDSLERYRVEHRNSFLGGLYSVRGTEWSRHRAAVDAPLHDAVTRHLPALNDVCEHFAQKMYIKRNYQDEVTTDLHKEFQKWAFDCIGLIIFSKKFTMLDTDLVYSQCDMSWLFHSLERATEALVKCESGLQLWKLVPTPAWNALVKNCDSLDNLIGKYVMECEQKVAYVKPGQEINTSLITSMLTGQDKMKAEDVVTILMDMLLLGVNTISSTMSFLVYHLAMYQRAQKTLYEEIRAINTEQITDFKFREETPYLQACIKETLRLVPPIPLLTRILPKNITLDRYNIPRGTLIIMSTQDAALKELNYDDANKFYPERWLNADVKDYHAFASIPFGFGARKCLGQNVAETMLSMMTLQLVQKYKLEYYYGEIQPTRSFIARPNKSLKVRLIDRI